MEIRGFTDTIKWYDNNAAKYAQNTQEAIPMDEVDIFINLLGNKKKILDAGCGAGRDTNIFTKKGFDVIGLDISQGLLIEAKRRYPNLQFIHGSLLEIPFDDKSFDGVWARMSLLHFETIDEVTKALKEIYRVLKLNGILHILAQSGDEKTSIFEDKFSGHKRFFRFFTIEELEALVKETGFKIISIDQYKETNKVVNGREDLELILLYAQK
jgi:ubiquinone/menaquinone biosynthesis C-methylase UbiE